MKASVLYEVNEPLAVVELEQEGPRAGEVLVRIGAAGLCASDHHIMTGTGALPLPVVLGHEGAGTVEAVGEGVTNVAPGDRCTLSFISNCGHCRNCRRGHPQLCETNRATGARQFDGTLRLRDDAGHQIHQMAKLGVFGERVVAPAQACYPIPDALSMEEAALVGCCVTTGVGAVINQPGISVGATVAVWGCGGVGLNVIQGARAMNAARVIAVDVRGAALEFAKAFGATDSVDASERDPVAAIKELTGGVDFAFDAIGNRVATQQAFESLAPLGTAVMVGLAPIGDEAPIDMVSLVRGQKSLVGSYYGSASPHETFAKVISLWERGALDIAGLVTRRYGLDDINQGFDDLAAGSDGRGVISFE